MTVLSTLFIRKRWQKSFNFLKIKNIREGKRVLVLRTLYIVFLCDATQSTRTPSHKQAAEFAARINQLYYYWKGFMATKCFFFTLCNRQNRKFLGTLKILSNFRLVAYVVFAIVRNTRRRAFFLHRHLSLCDQNKKVDKLSYRFICHCLWLRYDNASFWRKFMCAMIINALIKPKRTANILHWKRKDRRDKWAEC